MIVPVINFFFPNFNFSYLTLEQKIATSKMAKILEDLKTITTG